MWAGRCSDGGWSAGWSWSLGCWWGVVGVGGVAWWSLAVVVGGTFVYRRQELGSMCFWKGTSCSRLSGCCLESFLSSLGRYYWLVCVDLSVDPGGIVLSAGGWRFVWRYILLSIRLGSDGLLKVLFGWHWQCVGPLSGRLMVLLLLLSFWLWFAWSELWQMCVGGCGLHIWQNCVVWQAALLLGWLQFLGRIECSQMRSFPRS
jgi:hypothetical protein